MKESASQHGKDREGKSLPVVRGGAIDGQGPDVALLSYFKKNTVQARVYYYFYYLCEGRRCFSDIVILFTFYMKGHDG